MSKSAIDEVIESLDNSLEKINDTPKKEVKRNDFTNPMEESLFNLFKDIVGINIGTHGAENAILVVEKYLNEGNGYLDAFTSAYNSRVLISRIPPATMKDILSRYFVSNDLGDISRKLVYEEILDVKANLLNMASLATFDKYCAQDNDDQLRVALLDYLRTGDSKKFTNDFNCRDLIRESIQPYEVKVVVGYAASLDDVYNYGIHTQISDAQIVDTYVGVLKEFKKEDTMKY